MVNVVPLGEGGGILENTTFLNGDSHNPDHIYAAILSGESLISQTINAIMRRIPTDNRQAQIVVLMICVAPGIRSLSLC